MEMINTNNRCKTKEPEEYKPISWAVGAHLDLCGPYVRTAIDTLNNPEAVTMYGFFSQAPGDMSMELLFAYHDDPLVLKHLADIVRFGVRRHGGLNKYWVTCTEHPHRIVIALGPKALPAVDEFFKAERELYKRIAAGQEEQPVWWKEDSVEHLESWCKDMQVTAEIVKCLYGLKPQDQAVKSLCDIYLSNRPWGAWERRQIRDHFTKLGVSVVPALRQVTAATGSPAKARLDKEVAAKRAEVDAAGTKGREKERRQKELDALLYDAQRYEELAELASVIESLNAEKPSADDVRTLCRFYVKRPMGMAYPFTNDDSDYVGEYDQTQLALIRDALQRWGGLALPALRAFLAEDAKALADSLAQLDKDKAYWSEQRARLRGGPLARIAVEREEIRKSRAELKDLADLIDWAGKDKLSGEQASELCRMYTRRAWPTQNKLIAELLAKAGRPAAAAIADHVKRETQALPDIHAVILKGMEDPSSRAKKWYYDQAVTAEKDITRGDKELEAIAAAAK
jgi:hypothetical protein